MKTAIILILSLASFSALAMGDNYKKTKEGGYVYTGGSHLKGCSLKFQPQVTKKDFVINCMQVDGVVHRTPGRTRTIISALGKQEIIEFGRTSFYFTNGILDGIVD